MPKQRRNPKRILSTAGAFIAFMIGSGFSTGQETLQYFSSYGLWGLGGILICLVLLMYVSVSYVQVGFREKFSRPSLIYTYYCGEHIGSFFDYFTVVAIYLCFTVMIAGAGATMKQYFELPTAVGAVIIGVLAGGTVMLGLKHMVDVIGKIGPVIIALVMILGVGAILQGDLGSLGTTAVRIQGMDLMRASSNWVLSAFSKTEEQDLKPALESEKLEARILRDLEQYQNRSMENALVDLLPRSMIPVVLRRLDIAPDMQANSLTKQKRRALVELLKAFPIAITGKRPVSEAIITSGGVKVSEIDPKTMESKLVAGLHFAGEVIDCDAYTGGFNLQIAWATAYAAGMAVG